MSQQVVGERFRLLSVLGVGGNGRVWRAFDEKLGVEVAIKEVQLHPSSTDAERSNTIAQAESEARNAARLRNHPNIVAVYDVVTGAGQPWLVMRLVNGRTLEQELEVRGRLRPEEAGRIAAAVLEALYAAHSAGIVHRDVKPANIMLADDGTVLLTDFGIAKQYSTTTEVVLTGTLRYMSPERLSGKDLPAGDLFAVGVTIYEMTEGASPFARATPAATMSAVIMEHPVPPRYSGHLTNLVVALLEKDPARRPNAAAARMLVAGRAGFTPEEPTVIASTVPDLRFTSDSADPETKRRRRPSRRAILATGLGIAAAGAIPVALVLKPSAHQSDSAANTSLSPTAGHSAPRVRGPLTLSGGSSATPVAMSFNPGGTVFAAAREDGSATLWDTATWQATTTFTHHPVNPWSTPFDKVIAWNPRFTAALSLTFSPNGSVLAVGNGDGTISLWGLGDGAETTLPYIDPITWNGANGSIAFDPSGRSLASTYDMPSIRIWDLSTRTSRTTLTTTGDSWVDQLAFSPDGRILASATGNGNPNNTVDDGYLQLWDASSGESITTLAQTNSRGQALAFSPDGKTLASLRTDGRLTLWDIASRQTTRTVAPTSSGVTCIAFGSGGVVAGGFNDGTVTLWDAESGSAVAHLTTGTNHTVNYLAFSQDGKTIAGAGKVLSVWKLS
ncbi:MAG: Serine/threonine protein kinase [Nocardia sp.]|uniref:WD40 repeat domain-containing serine/threonine protein kinase n=1 Tax=Nocardia sp. TaxID=1821 RepID=UPI00262271FF|nr:serine/threonine-protein kinase [Nocardia sp.]MCU1647319.1 Serine/threonine protein kinase [Nocardia sp.]